MKNQIHFTMITILLFGLIGIISLSGCFKSPDDNPGELIWDEDWLICTLEGTTPSNIQPFAGKKIKIVFTKAHHYQTDSAQENVIKTYFYDGTFTWDESGNKWSTTFNANNYPDPGVNTIDWQSAHMTLAKNTMNTMSIRIGDITQTDPWHSFDLDWGPFVSSSTKPQTTIELYGDIEIEANEELERADYPPSNMIRLTKK